MHPRFSLVYEGEDAEVWKNNDFLPRAFIVHRVVAMPDDHQALAYIKAEADLDLSRLAIIDEQVPQEILMRLNGAPVQGYSNVTILSYEANRISLRAEVQDEGFLVLSDNWFPGWTVTVDREPSRVYRADYTFRGVFLKRGDHIVEFVYDPVSLKLGGCLCLIGVATMACMIILEQRRKIHVICARHSWNCKKPPLSTAISGVASTDDSRIDLEFTGPHALGRGNVQLGRDLQSFLAQSIWEQTAACT
jgi:hypothetical protein